MHAYAQSQGIAVRTPTSMRDPAEIEAFKALELDAAVVVAFGQILPRDVLEAPRLGACAVTLVAISRRSHRRRSSRRRS